MESEEAKASQMPVWPQKGQVVQAWFGRKKRSPRGRKEVEDNLIEAEQSQETPIKRVQGNSTEDTEDIKSIEDMEDIEDVEDIENIGDIEDMENIKNIEYVEDIEGFGNKEGVENFENIEGIDDIEVEEANDIEEMEGSKAMECTETDIQTGRPKIKSPGAKKMAKYSVAMPLPYPGNSWQQLGYKGKKMLEG